MANTKRKRWIKDAFFDKIAELRLALTFDDVRLKTGYSEVLPKDVVLDSWFSRHVSLKIPLVSAAMDTVTRAEMAIAMAMLGGIGVIHRNLDPEEQASEVARVKFYLNGLIEKPICVFEDETIEMILNHRADKRYKFHTFPVLSRSGKLVGILTKNDFDFCQDHSMVAKKVMTTGLITGRKETSFEEAHQLMQKEKKKALPLVNKEGLITGLYVWSDLDRIRSGSRSSYNMDKKGRLRVAAAIGIGEDALIRTKLLEHKGVDAVVIDTAHGDSKGVLDVLKKIKKEYPHLDVVAGNVSEPASVERLIKAGADGIKVGQGPGSICTTRIIAGIGCPQLTAVYNCSKVADEQGVPVCADGGIRFSGDITIAIGAGAQCVMLGGLLAGTKESPGEVIFAKSRSWKSYRGMGSLSAMQERRGSRERYGQEDSGKGDLVPEGVEGLVPFKGALRDVLVQLLGGLRSGMGYVGALTIQELRERADFIRISSAGQAESHPHDVEITREAPNYRVGRE